MKKFLLLFCTACIPMLLLGQSTQIPYPLSYCIISKQKLGEMGNPTTIIYKNHEIKFCCGGCPKEFYKDPDHFLQEIEKTAKH